MLYKYFFIYLIPNYEVRYIIDYFKAGWRFKHWSRRCIRHYQLHKAREIVNHAYHNSPFFKEFYDGYNLKDPWSLPHVNKGILMANFTKYNTLGLMKDDVINFCLYVEKERNFTLRYQGMNVGMSSGTSGNKGIEVASRAEESKLKQILFARFPRLKGEKMNIAFILRVSSPAFNINVLGHKLTYINPLAPLDRVAAQLEALNPNCLTGQPSFLKILADRKKSGELNIHPKMLVSYAEVLSPDVKAHLINVFECPIYEIYKCTEAAIAMSCKEGSLHINEDVVAVQLYDKDGKPTPDGLPCHKMVVTNLLKKELPVIQYELNDIITISPEKCACGSNFRVIKQIHGRADDMFYGSNDEPILPDFIARAIISGSNSLEEYQAIQRSRTDVLVRVMPAISMKEKIAIRDNICHIFKSYGCAEPKVEVNVEPVAYKDSGKLIRIFRDFWVGQV